MNVFHHQNYLKNTIGLKNQKTISLILKNFNHQLQGLPWIIPCLFIGMHANQVLSPIIEVKQMQEYSKVCLFDSMSNQISNHVREVSITPYFFNTCWCPIFYKHTMVRLSSPSEWMILLDQGDTLSKEKERKKILQCHPFGTHMRVSTWCALVIPSMVN